MERGSHTEPSTPLHAETPPSRAPGTAAFQFSILVPESGRRNQGSGTLRSRSVVYHCACGRPVLGLRSLGGFANKEGG